MSNEINKLPVPASEQRVLDNLLRDLNETYPDKVIRNLGRDHKKWDEKVTRLYKNIGYESRNEFLAAYGFTVEQGKSGRPTIDVKAIAEELVSRYEGDRFVTSIDQLKEENPDLAANIKSLQNKSKELFGMTLNKYLKERGVFQSNESEAANRQEEFKGKITPIIEELKKRYETKEIPTSLTALKDDNKDIEGIICINDWTEKAYGRKALEYFKEIGLVKEKEKVEIKKEQKRAKKLVAEKPKAPAEPIIPEFTSSEEVEAFCRENFVPGLLAQFAKKIGIRENAFKGVKYKKF